VKGVVNKGIQEWVEESFFASATRSISGAVPRRFEFEELPTGRLHMRYHCHSDRKLCALLRGLILGIGDLFQQLAQVDDIARTDRGHSHCIKEIAFP